MNLTVHWMIVEYAMEITQLCSGCSDPNALNFDDFATIDDGTCIYSTLFQLN